MFLTWWSMPLCYTSATSICSLFSRILISNWNSIWFWRSWLHPSSYGEVHSILLATGVASGVGTWCKPSNQSKFQVFSSLDLRYGMGWGCMEPWELLTSPLDHKKKSLPENGANIQKAGGEMERKPEFWLPDVTPQKSLVWKQFFRITWFQLHESVSTLSCLAQFDSSVLLLATKNILTDACEMALSYGCLPLDRLQFANDPLTRFPEQNLLF